MSFVGMAWGHDACCVVWCGIGGHKSTQEEKDKIKAAQKVAIERAQMRIRQQRR